MNTSLGLLELPELAVDVVEQNERARKGARACELERHIKFDTAILESLKAISLVVFSQFCFLVLPPPQY